MDYIFEPYINGYDCRRRSSNGTIIAYYVFSVKEQAFGWISANELKQKIKSGAVCKGLTLTGNNRLVDGKKEVHTMSEEEFREFVRTHPNWRNRYGR